MNITKRVFTYLGALSLGFWLTLATPASAITITTLDAPVEFTISYDVGNGLVLNATGSLTVTDGFNSSFLTVHVLLNNSSTLNGVDLTSAANVRLTAWGFGVDPNATGLQFLDAGDGGLVDASLDSIPSLSAIEVCAWGGNNCSGGGNSGIQAGSFDTFDLVLAGAWGNSVIFDPLGVKFQTALTSYEFQCRGTVACTEGTPTADLAVPEPQSLALIGLGMIILAGFSRRKRTA
jgi:hypothetical protein